MPISKFDDKDAQGRHKLKNYDYVADNCSKKLIN